jgi:hypothetical protein
MIKQTVLLIIAFTGFGLNSLQAQLLWDTNRQEKLNKEGNGAVDTGFQFSGYVRSGVYGWVSGEDRKSELKSGYGEFALRVKTREKGWGNGVAEIRLRKGYEYGSDLFDMQLREAYINLSLGPWNFRAGQQIVAWGRADGLNPTNNITPQNYMVRSPNYDDRRVGNIVFRSWLHLSPFKFETIWVPFYKSSIPPFDMINFPIGVSFSDSTHYPDHHITNSSFAFRMHFEFSSLDGSVSYYNGFHHLPALSAQVDLSGMNFFPVAYRTHVIGVDFSTTLGAWGIRGEGAYKFSKDDYSHSLYLPHPEFQYVLGVDRMIGDMNFIVQYLGKSVYDFSELLTPTNPLEIPAYEIQKANRMFAMQQNKISHSLSTTINWSLFYETFNIEFRTLYHFTTKEYMLNPNLSYKISDALNVTLGANYYRGAEGTLYDITDDLFSDIYIEFKCTF